MKLNEVRLCSLSTIGSLSYSSHSILQENWFILFFISLQIYFGVTMRVSNMLLFACLALSLLVTAATDAVSVNISKLF